MDLNEEYWAFLADFASQHLEQTPMLSSPQEFFRYLPVSEEDKRWDFYVTGAGYSDVPPGSRYPRSVHPNLYQFAWARGRVLPEYQVLYLTRGEGIFESRRTGRREMKTGCVLMLFPGVWHRYRPLKEIGWTEYWVSFNGDYAQRLAERGFFTPDDPLLAAGLDDAVLQPYLRLQERVRLELPGYRQLIAADLMEILAAALASVRIARTGNRAVAMVREAKTMLADRVEKTLDLERLAAALHMSYAHFRRVFKQQTGLSPYQYHLQLRIHRARELLHGTTLSVRQVAAQLRFENPYHFSKIFKKKTGMSPKQCRCMGQENG